MFHEILDQFIQRVRMRKSQIIQNCSYPFTGSNMQWILFSIFSLFVLLVYPISSYSTSQLHSEQGNFSFSISMDWVEIPQETLKQQISEFKKTIKGKVPDVSYEFAFQHTSSEYYFKYPYFLVGVFRKRVDSRTPYQWQKKIESEIKTSFDKAGMEHLASDLQTIRPIYDQKQRLLTYTTQFNKVQGENGQSPITHLNAIFFGKERVISFNFYSLSDEFDHYRSQFKAVTDSFSFDSGYDYLPDFWERILKAALVGIGLALLSGYLYKRNRKR